MVSSYEQMNDAGGRPDVPRVRIESSQRDGRRRVALVGEIDIANVAVTEAALVPMVGAEELVLDLAKLTYCDSQGVAMLFRLSRHASDNGGSLTIANPQGIVSRVFEITRLDEAIDVVIDL